MGSVAHTTSYGNHRFIQCVTNSGRRSNPHRDVDKPDDELNAIVINF